MTSNNSFECDNCCGGFISFVTGPDRQKEIRQNKFITIPENFPVATCDKCGEMYFSTMEVAELEALSAESEALSAELEALCLDLNL
jgi:hypothetical protein